MRDVIRLLRGRPRYRRLWLGNLVSQLGDWIGWVAVSVLALHPEHGQDGAALNLALVFLAHNLPVAALAPVAGPVADRLDRRLVLLATTAASAALTLGMAVAATLGGLWLVQLLLLARSAVTAFFTPAERAALPRLVAREELLLAGTVESVTWSVVFAFGMAAGGALALLGPVTALVIDAGSFVLAFALLIGLPAMRARPREEAARAGDRRSSLGLLRALGVALRRLGPRPRLLRAVAAKTPFALAAGAAWLVLNLVAEDVVFQKNAAWGAGLALGLLHAARGVGAGLGPLIATRLIGRGRGRDRVWNSLVSAGLAAALLFVALPPGPALLGLAVLWGVGAGGNWVLSSEALQRLGPDHLLGRLGALDHLGFVLAQSVSVLGAALLVEYGLPHALAAAPWIVGGALLWWALARRVALADGASPRGPFTGWRRSWAGSRSARARRTARSSSPPVAAR